MSFWANDCFFGPDNIKDEIFEANTFEKCETSCVDSDSCQSFNWNEKKKVCELVNSYASQKTALRVIRSNEQEFCGVKSLIYFERI